MCHTLSVKIKNKIKSEHCGKTVMGTPPDLKGKHPFTPYSGFTPGTPVSTHHTSARQRYAPMISGSD